MSKFAKRFITIFLIAILVLFMLNNLLVFFERQNEGSSIKSLSDSFWYLAVTLTTVGYGDMYPTTTGGRIIGFVYVLASFGLLGFLITTTTKYIFNIMEARKLGHNGTDFRKHILIIGWNNFSRMVAEEISHAGKKMAIVTDDRNEIEHIYNEFGKQNTFVLYSDYQNFEMLDKVNPEGASEVFINFEDDTESLIYVINFRKLYSHVQIVISIKNSDLKDTFAAAGVRYVVARNELASKLVASYIFEPDVATLNYDILSSAKTDEEFDNQEYQVIQGNPYVGMDYLEAFIKMKREFNAVLLGVSKPKDGDYVLIENPSAGVTINQGDFLILMVNNAAKVKVEDLFGVPEGRL